MAMTLDYCRGILVAEKVLGVEVLHALALLCAEAFLADSPDIHEDKKRFFLLSNNSLTRNAPTFINEVPAKGSLSTPSSIQLSSSPPYVTHPHPNVHEQYKHNSQKYR